MNVICTVYDQKARLFSAPFTSATEETAIRDFARAVSDTRSMVDKFPQDYELHCLGSFDEVSGEIEPAAISKLLA
ncbi:VP5 [Gokushovirus WZ-2015a]|nr:VP5 [Gokushovirus WZ-2015a]